jgi:hypothetical protein
MPISCRRVWTRSLKPHPTRSPVHTAQVVNIVQQTTELDGNGGCLMCCSLHRCRASASPRAAPFRRRRDWAARARKEADMPDVSCDEMQERAHFP